MYLKHIKNLYNLVNPDWIDGPCRPVPFLLLHPLREDYLLISAQFTKMTSVFPEIINLDPRQALFLF
jgi:hypothetical protein